MQVEELLLSVGARIKTNEIDKVLSKLTKLDKLYEKLKKQNITTKDSVIKTKILSILNYFKPLAKITNIILKPFKLLAKATNKLLKSFSYGFGFLKRMSLIIGGLYGNLMMFRRDTRGLQDEADWTGQKNTLAYKLMNTATINDMISPKAVADQIQSIYEQHRMMRATGAINDTELASVLGQLGTTISKPVNDILEDLTKISKHMDSSNFYTLLDSIGKGDVARAILARNKQGDAPEIYTEADSRELKDFSIILNKNVIAPLKSLQRSLAMKSVPLFIKIGNLIGKISKNLEPIIAKLLQTIDKAVSYLTDDNTSIIDGFKNAILTLAEPIGEVLRKAIGMAMYGVFKDVPIIGRQFQQFAPDKVLSTQQEIQKPQMTSINNNSTNTINNYNNVSRTFEAKKQHWRETQQLNKVIDSVNF